MKLATVASLPDISLSTADGYLVVVDDVNKLVASVAEFPTLQLALSNWSEADPVLQKVSKDLLSGKRVDALPFDRVVFKAPLPRSYAFLDGSAFIQHIVLVRKARKAPLPEALYERPLMYQGASDAFLGPCDVIPLGDEEWGLDFEGEFAVVVDNVPAGTTAEVALSSVRLILLMNDISLRNLVPEEVKTGFGFVQSKPPSAFAPFAVTPDELGDTWAAGRVHLPLTCWRNDQLIGSPSGEEMYFSFGQLIAHACRTRDLTAGTIIGSGTVSNESTDAGFTCLAEKRMAELLTNGEIVTDFLRGGETIAMEAFLHDRSLFGRIEQSVVKAEKKTVINQ